MTKLKAKSHEEACACTEGLPNYAMSDVYVVSAFLLFPGTAAGL